jgi:VanZ family protein
LHFDGHFDEIYQSMVAGREGKVQDLALDLGAAVLMALVAQLFGFAVKRRILWSPSSA